MQLRQGEDARPDTKHMSCHPTQSRQGEDARPSVKLMSCHPTQLRQGEDPRHFIVSVKRMSYHPTQLRLGEDARLVITMSTGAPFLQYVVSDIIEPLFPGETSVFWIHTIQMLPNLPRPRIAPWSPLRRQNRDIQKRTRSKACILHKLCMTAVTKDGRW